jgi:MurNAc alpha-1-phosphate uridylyltransferase
LIDYNFERLKNINIEKFVVNLCYKGNMIKDHILKKHPDLNIVFSEEEEALETGGGVKKALPLLKEQAFFVSNSDVFFIDKGYKSALWKMIDEWDENKYDILILLQDLKDICGDKSIGDYRIDKNGRPERNENKISGFPYMFSGISIVNRKIFENVTEEKFSLRDLFDVAQKNEKLGFVINDADFFHVGTPEALKEAKMRIKVKK